MTENYILESLLGRLFWLQILNILDEWMMHQLQNLSKTMKLFLQ